MLAPPKKPTTAEQMENLRLNDAVARYTLTRDSKTVGDLDAVLFPSAMVSFFSLYADARFGFNADGPLGFAKRLRGLRTKNSMDDFLGKYYPDGQVPDLAWNAPAQFGIMHFLYCLMISARTLMTEKGVANLVDMRKALGTVQLDFITDFVLLIAMKGAKAMPHDLKKLKPFDPRTLVDKDASVEIPPGFMEQVDVLRQEVATLKAANVQLEADKQGLLVIAQDFQAQLNVKPVTPVLIPADGPGAAPIMPAVPLTLTSLAATVPMGFKPPAPNSAVVQKAVATANAAAAAVADAKEETKVAEHELQVGRMVLSTPGASARQAIIDAGGAAPPAEEDNDETAPQPGRLKRVSGVLAGLGLSSGKALARFGWKTTKTVAGAGGSVLGKGVDMALGRLKGDSDKLQVSTKKTENNGNQLAVVVAKAAAGKASTAAVVAQTKKTEASVEKTKQLTVAVAKDVAVVEKAEQKLVPVIAAAAETAAANTLENATAMASVTADGEARLANTFNAYKDGPTLPNITFIPSTDRVTEAENFVSSEGYGVKRFVDVDGKTHYIPVPRSAGMFNSEDPPEDFARYLREGFEALRKGKKTTGVSAWIVAYIYPWYPFAGTGYGTDYDEEVFTWRTMKDAMIRYPITIGAQPAMVKKIYQRIRKAAEKSTGVPDKTL